MKIKFYGTRGSVPVCETSFQEFGGNTTCLSVTGGENDDMLILDAGTGIRTLGKELMQKEFSLDQRIVIAFSHFHWDHIQGFPFFDPAYDATKLIRLVAYGEALSIDSIREVLARQMENVFFPVSLDDMGAQFSFATERISEQAFPKGKLLVNAHNHPGGAHGYRVEVDDQVFVYCTDVEHSDGIDQKVVDFARGADLLVHDAQYTPEELEKHKGWGHSSWEQAIEVAEQAGVKQLYLTHHDPDHNDAFLCEIEQECQRHFPACYLAREGDEIVL